MTNSRAQAADAEACVRPAIPLPEPVRDHSASVVPDSSAHVQQATPCPEPPPGASDSDADLRAIDGAVAVLGATLTETERHIAAGALSQFRTIVGRTTQRAERLHRSLRGRIVRRPRASRAPRRAAHRSAVAPARDGPPPPSDGPTPVASRATRGAGGSR